MLDRFTVLLSSVPVHKSTSTASVHWSVPKPHMIPNFRMSRDAFHIIIKCMLTWAPTRSHPSASSWMMSQLQLIYKTLTTLTYNHTHTQTIQTIILHTRTRKDINLRPKDGRPQFLNFKLAISSIGLFNELENVTRERTIDFIQFYELIELTAKRSPIFSVADDRTIVIAMQFLKLFTKTITVHIWSGQLSAEQTFSSERYW